MKVIYIAGPFRADNAWAVEQNIRKAESLGMAVAKMGHAYLCPHTNSRFFDGTITDKYWLEMTMELMRRCDAVLVAPEYQGSEGTEGEIVEAWNIGMSVFYNLGEVNTWLDAVEGQ